MVALCSAEGYLGSAALPAVPVSASSAENLSTAHVVLSEPGQSCQQVTAFIPALSSTPERQSPSSPVSVPDSTFLLVHRARRQLVRQLHLAPAKAKCRRSP